MLNSKDVEVLWGKILKEKVVSNLFVYYDGKGGIKTGFQVFWLENPSTISVYRATAWERLALAGAEPRQQTISCRSYCLEKGKQEFEHQTSLWRNRHGISQDWVSVKWGSHPATRELDESSIGEALQLVRVATVVLCHNQRVGQTMRSLQQKLEAIYDHFWKMQQ